MAVTPPFLFFSCISLPMKDSSTRGRRTRTKTVLVTASTSLNKSAVSHLPHPRPSVLCPFLLPLLEDMEVLLGPL